MSELAQPSRDSNQDADALPDLLEDAARLTRAWAPLHCSPTHARHDGCANYHRAWSTLRLVGAISGARTDQDFFLREFTETARSHPNAHVLIAGTADHAVLHMLLQAFSSVGGRPVVTVVDSCNTTLRLNHWYAEQVGTQVRCVQGDLKKFQLSDQFDLITTHSVFSFMDNTDVQTALCNWHGHLAAGGKLKLVQGIRPELADGSTIEFNNTEVTEFTERALLRWEKGGPYAGLDGATLRQLATGFARHKKVHAVTAARHLLDGLASAGYRVEAHSQTDRRQLGYATSAPSVTELAFSLRLVARRGCD